VYKRQTRCYFVGGRTGVPQAPRRTRLRTWPVSTSSVASAISCFTVIETPALRLRVQSFSMINLGDDGCDAAHSSPSHPFRLISRLPPCDGIRFHQRRMKVPFSVFRFHCFLPAPLSAHSPPTPFGEFAEGTRLKACFGGVSGGNRKKGVRGCAVNKRSGSFAP
jgi:hypothetical protein